MDQGAAAERSRDLERFLTFVDAVVAIAITLLVLPLVDVVNALGDASVASLLHAHVAQVYGFLLSFAVIGQLWFAQHQVMRTVVAHDPLVTRLVMVWLLSIVVLPFPTALVAQAGEQPLTKVLYIGTMALSAALLALMAWRIAAVRSIRDSDDAPDPTSALTFVLFLVALALSLAVPSLGYYPLLLLLLTGVLVRAWHRLRDRRAAARRVGD